MVERTRYHEQEHLVTLPKPHQPHPNNCEVIGSCTFSLRLSLPGKPSMGNTRGGDGAAGLWGVPSKCCSFKTDERLAHDLVLACCSLRRRRRLTCTTYTHALYTRLVVAMPTAVTVRCLCSSSRISAHSSLARQRSRVRAWRKRINGE